MEGENSKFKSNMKNKATSSKIPIPNALPINTSKTNIASSGRTRRKDKGKRRGSDASSASQGRPPLPPPSLPAPECREQDPYLPIANIVRVMRNALPAHAKISDNAKETMQQSVCEFVSFITQEAKDHCQSEVRKTITAEDIITAMSTLGFDQYVEPLTLYLEKYRKAEGAIRGRTTQLEMLKSSMAGPSSTMVNPAMMMQGPPQMPTPTHPHSHPYYSVYDGMTSDTTDAVAISTIAPGATEINFGGDTNDNGFDLIDNSCYKFGSSINYNSFFEFDNFGMPPWAPSLGNNPAFVLTPPTFNNAADEEAGEDDGFDEFAPFK